MSSDITADLAIIGSGSAAFAAAIAARRKDLTVVMIESGTVGGTCVNVGCVPSKALLATASARQSAADSRFPGAATDAAPVDWAAVRAAKDDLVATMREEKYTDLAAEYDWEILHGTARFTGTHEAPAVEVDLAGGGTQTVEAAHYLVATGASPWAPPIPGLAETPYLTSTTAMDLEALPESMIVIGGNAIGLEQGQMFARLGVQVTVIEALDRLAPFEEPELSEVITEAFAAEGIGVVTGASITCAKFEGDAFAVAFTDVDGTDRKLDTGQLLVATGRRPNTDGLGLDKVGVALAERGAVAVDASLRTENPRVWAAGDVTGYPQFVYNAASGGTMVVANAFDEAGKEVDYTRLPRVTFTSPALASVGLTDAQAVEAGFECDCRTLPMSAVPRAIVNRDTTGAVKLVADGETGRLLGVHIAAEAAGDMILAGIYALRAGMTIEDMTDEWNPYLTEAEAIKLAAQTFTTDVAKLSCCAA
ncbi:mercury(II) reductase [Glycomyces tenuis]|uniref:mercury(II) reductase n=1 Tax=Glycomyces tenuis TaxID=58116 RepID=UPI00040D23B6|nr:mercury(II) reductase [Glycomyces tenuis]